MNALDLVLDSLVFAEALVLLWAYAWGNAWYASRVGRALVGLAAGIAVLTGLGVVRRVLGGGEADWQATGGLIVVVLIVAGLDLAFVRERNEMRRREAARKIHLIEKEEAHESGQ